MEKPRGPIYWEKRDGIDAFVLGRIAVPGWFAGTIVWVAVIAGIVLFAVGVSLGIWWMILPIGIPVSAIIFYALWLALFSAVDDFRRVNRKNL